MLTSASLLIPRERLADEIAQRVAAETGAEVQPGEVEGPSHEDLIVDEKQLTAGVDGVGLTVHQFPIQATVDAA